jgi:hypothetical protein
MNKKSTFEDFGVRYSLKMYFLAQMIKHLGITIFFMVSDLKAKVPLKFKE